MHMKTRYFFLIALLSAASVVSCQQMEKPIFTSPASSRMENVLDRFQNVLSNPKGGNGWYMAYFTQQDKTMGGSIYTIQFDKPAKGEATIFHEDVTPAAGWGDSCNYKLSRDDGPVLSFDTYNVAMHYFSTSSSEYYQSRGGDFEFELMSACPDSVVMRGKRSRNIFKMYPLEEAPDTYIQKVVQMSQDMTLGMVEAEISGGLVVMELDLGNRTITIGRKGALEDELTSIPFRFTPTGFSLYEPLDLQGVVFKDFVFDSDNASLISNGITFNMVVPEGYMPYSKYLGKYQLKNALGTREVTLSEVKKGSSYKLSGLSAKYDIDVRYSAGQGILLIYVQQIGVSDSGDSQYWLTVSDGDTFTWSPSAAVCTKVDDVEKDNFVLTFTDAGYYPSIAISSFWLAEFTGAPSSNTYVKGGITIPEWQFFEKDAEMSFPITLTKIVE